MRNHVVISGTGRAGTTFLVELLTYLGLDTGYDRDSVSTSKTENKYARAGLEGWDIRDQNAPYVIKSTHFCNYAKNVVRDPNITIDGILIPMRDLSAASRSREYVNVQTITAMPLLHRIKRKLSRVNTKVSPIPGGLWGGATDAHSQEDVLLRKFYSLNLALSGSFIPVTLLRYPQITRDSEYLFNKIRPILPDIDFASFDAVFKEVADQKLVHSFSADDI